MVAYLRTAVINGARSALRSRGRRNALLIKAAQHDPPVWSAEAAAIDGEDRRALMTAVAGLTQRQRDRGACRDRAHPSAQGAGMNDIEDRLRDTCQAVERAIRPETIRPRVFPAGSERPRSTRFVPLAAAAAVIAVIAGAVTLPHLLTGSPAPGTLGLWLAGPRGD